MITSIHWLNVDSFLAQGIQPVVCLERPLKNLADDKLFLSAKPGRDGTYRVAASPLSQSQVDWSLVTTGDFVRIPVFAYTTTSAALSAILFTGLELGLAAARSLAATDKQPVEQIIMVLGEDCHHLEDRNCFRCYIGLAFRLKPQ
jgi:hypothetical protein